jgi:hypothetical protein
VAAAADGNRKALRARELDRPDDVSGHRRANDRRRSPVDHRVEHAACVVVAGIAGAQNLAAQGGAELSDRGLC